MIIIIIKEQNKIIKEMMQKMVEAIVKELKTEGFHRVVKIIIFKCEHKPCKISSYHLHEGILIFKEKMRLDMISIIILEYLFDIDFKDLFKKYKK